MSSAPQARSVQQTAAKSQKPPPAPDVGLRGEDPRSASQLASRRLLFAELKRMESLLKQTPIDSPDRPVLLRRIAETYAQIEALAVQERERARLRAEEAEREQRLKQRLEPKRRSPRTVL